MFFLSQNPTAMELTLLACAVGGTLFFILRVVLVLFAGIGAEDLSSSHGDASGLDAGDPHSGIEGHDAHGTEVAFKLFSLNSISAFFMMFGWGGLASYVEFRISAGGSLLIACLAGLLTMALTAYFFVWIRRMQSSGADFRLEDIVGLNAKVYQRIPAQGSGKIHVTYNGMLRELSAESADNTEIESFSSVVIKSVRGQSTVAVERSTN